MVQPLVKGLGLQKMGWGTGGGWGNLALPPHGRHVVLPRENYALLHIKTICNTIVV